MLYIQYKISLHVIHSQGHLCRSIILPPYLNISRGFISEDMAGLDLDDDVVTWDLQASMDCLHLSYVIWKLFWCCIGLLCDLDLFELSCVVLDYYVIWTLSLYLNYCVGYDLNLMLYYDLNLLELSDKFLVSGLLISVSVQINIRFPYPYSSRF